MLCRTSIDWVLFERLSAHREVIAARQLFIKAERPVTRTITGEIVSGDVDYALGYEIRSCKRIRKKTCVRECVDCRGSKESNHV